MEKIIALCIFLVLATLSYSFLYYGKLSSTIFCFLLGGLIIALLAFYFGDRLKELDIRNLRMVLNDMKETVNDSKQLGEEIAGFLAYNTAVSNRWAGNDHIYKRWEERKRIEEFLRKLGTDSKSINERLSVLDRYITLDLFHDLTKKISINDGTTFYNDWVRMTRDNLVNGNISTIDLDDLDAKLNEVNVDLDTISTELTRLKNFVRNKELMK